MSSPTANIVRLTLRAPAPAVNSDDQRADDLPLLRARILRLVEQQVIDAEIELVEHPGGGAAVEQRERAVDQVVIVEQAAPRLVAR